MAQRIIKKRYFLAVEGQSEQSFVRWIQALADERLSIHLDTYPLGGGGFSSMLKDAVHWHAKEAKSKGAYRQRFLIVDADRADVQDWSLDKLRKEAAKQNFIVIVQRPNHEGLLYRMAPGKENDVPSASMAKTKLRKFWPDYEKPVNAQALERHFSLADLMRVAGADPDLTVLLARIGLI